VPESIRFVIEEASRTAEVRRAASGLARDLGLDEEGAAQVAIVVTEASTNVLKYGGGGEILLRLAGDDPQARPELEALALDRGPGMPNLTQCMEDGFSTGGSPGQGLGAITRLSSASDVYSDLSRGTALLARWWKGSNNGHGGLALRAGAVNVRKPGQEVCGDSWGIVQSGQECVVMVADGLGHGLEAKTASLEAVRMLHQHSELAPGELLERTHQALRSSRGAAVAVARIDRTEGSLTYAGMGNIAGQIYTGARPGQHLVSINGTAGHTASRIREFKYAWPDHGMLVLHSDGLSTGTSLDAYPGLALRDPALIAGVLYRDFSRGNDDSTVVVVKAA